MLNSELFVADLPVLRKLETINTAGESVEIEVYVKELGLNEFRSQMMTERDGSPEEKRNALALLISRSIVDASGNPEMTPEQAAKLRPSVGAGLRDLILGVNGLGE